MNERNYIIFEGLIGVGKTTISSLIAKKYDARLVLEQFEENPFLASFYEDQDRYAFQTELSFLASRYKQQEKIASRELFNSLTISDYMFEKNRIFAGLTLKGDELALYDRIYTIMRERAPNPDLIVYLHASVDHALSNIHKRGRPYEQNISADYLSALSLAYQNYLGTYSKSPVVIVDCNGIDFLKEQSYLAELETIVFNEPLKSGIHHFAFN